MSVICSGVLVIAKCCSGRVKGSHLELEHQTQQEQQQHQHQLLMMAVQQVVMQSSVCAPDSLLLHVQQSQAQHVTPAGSVPCWLTTACITEAALTLI